MLLKKLGTSLANLLGKSVHLSIHAVIQSREMDKIPESHRL